MLQGKRVLMGHYPRPSQRNSDSSVIKTYDNTDNLRRKVDIGYQPAQQH